MVDNCYGSQLTVLMKWQAVAHRPRPTTWKCVSGLATEYERQTRSTARKAHVRLHKSI